MFTFGRQVKYSVAHRLAYLFVTIIELSDGDLL